MLNRFAVGVTRLKTGARFLRAARLKDKRLEYEEDPRTIVDLKKFPRSVLSARRRHTEFYLKLALAKTPSGNQWRRWRTLVRETHARWEDIVNPPLWLLVHLLTCKVHSPVDAVKAATLVLRHARKFEAAQRSALLITTTRTLAKHQVSPPMKDVIESFIETPLTRPQLHYNYALVAISHFRMTPELGKLVTRILAAMHERQIKLGPKTFRILLSNRIISLELAKMLQRREAHNDPPQDIRQLEVYLRLFAKAGVVHASARYLNLIKDYRLAKDKEAPYGVVLSNGANVDSNTRSAALRWNTEFLTSFTHHSGSGFHYLRSMLAAEQLRALSRIPKKVVRFASRHKKNRPTVWKRGIHVSDWVTVLQSAGLDENISGRQLLNMFAKIRATTGMHVTVAVITVLMRGLLKKGDYTTAYQLWTLWVKTSKRDRILDNKSLTIAMAVLVGSGHPLEAWDTLVNAADVLSEGEHGTKGERRISIGIHGKTHRLHHPVKVDARLINSLMSAFLEHGRTDMVFKLWEAFTPLFDVYPDTVTMTLLLRAAREAARFDRTFRGLLEQMGLHDIFQKKKTWPDFRTKTKKEIAQSLRTIIYRGSIEEQGRQALEVKGIRKALWNDSLAGLKVHEMFKTILFGNFPRLMRIISPATAIWPDNAQAGHPIRDALRAIGVTRLHRSIDDTVPGPLTTGSSDSPLLIGPALLQPPTSPAEADSSETNGAKTPTSPDPVHPQIMPDAKTFGAYIELLGGLGRGSEVAQALAWMRALSVRPTRRTLALALVLWSEVSMRGPLLERYGGVSEYEKLYRWLVHWLGHQNMPTEGMMGWAFRYWKGEREK